MKIPLKNKFNREDIERGISEFLSNTPEVHKDQKTVRQGETKIQMFDENALSESVEEIKEHKENIGFADDDPLYKSIDDMLPDDSE